MLQAGKAAERKGKEQVGEIFMSRPGIEVEKTSRGPCSAGKAERTLRPAGRFGPCFSTATDFDEMDTTRVWLPHVD
jgi:hypothetical protein